MSETPHEGVEETPVDPAPAENDGEPVDEEEAGSDDEDGA